MDSLLTRAGVDDNDKELTGPTQVIVTKREHLFRRILYQIFLKPFLPENHVFQYKIKSRLKMYLDMLAMKEFDC